MKVLVVIQHFLDSRALIGNFSNGAHRDRYRCRCRERGTETEKISMERDRIVMFAAYSMLWSGTRNIRDHFLDMSYGKWRWHALMLSGFAVELACCMVGVSS